LSSTILSEFWDDLVAHNRQALFLVLVAFLGSFAFIRFSARIGRSPRASWWPGSVVSEGGVHLHHLVWGICLMLACGTLGFAFSGTSPWLEIFACGFGIGAGLTIDEFALWVYLEDVYWAEEGRTSIDAAVIAGAVMLLVLLDAQPIEIATGSFGAVAGGIFLIAVLVTLVIVCLAKQRVMHGALGTLLWPLAIYGAIRLGKPGSPWGKRFYGRHGGRKLAKAQRRFRPDRRTDRVKERFRDAVGGHTSAVSSRGRTRT
jgi:hypothetical protein